MKYLIIELTPDGVIERHMETRGVDSIESVKAIVKEMQKENLIPAVFQRIDLP